MNNKPTNFRGNIILLALFVLFASSLIGLLISMMMRGFLRYSEDIASYQKASYLAKAGAELGFSLISSSKANFDYRLTANDQAHLLKNFTCQRQTEENGICPDFNLDLQIIGLGNSLNTCSQKTPITLQGGQSLIIPAFYAQKSDLNTNTLILLDTPTFEGSTQNLSLKIAKILNNDGNTSVALEDWSSNNRDTKSYFIITNSSKDPVNICPTGKNIPQENIKILSTATYREKNIGREYLSVQKLPDFLKSDNYLTNQTQN